MKKEVEILSQTSESFAGEISLSPNTTAIETAKSRAIMEIQAALTIAKTNPRRMIDAVTAITEECQRHSLAEKSLYSYPRGGETISGPTIRLAEVLARNWGNVDYGFREMEQSGGQSRVETFCHDLQTNTRVKREFILHHKIKLKSGQFKHLTDPRDIYEIMANNAQRRVRACILEIIPGDIVDLAIETIKQTLAKGKAGEPHIDRVKRVVLGFDKIQISRELIEKRLKKTRKVKDECKVESITPEEIVELQAIFNSIKDGESKREDWFQVDVPTEGGKADELNAAVKDQGEEVVTEEIPNPFEKKEGK